MKTRSKYLGLHIALVSLLYSSFAIADEPFLLIDEAVNNSLNTSTLVTEIESNSLNKHADSLEANTLANPTLEAEFGVPTGWKESRGDNEISLSLTQSFKFSDGALRNRLSRLIDDEADSEKEQAILELVIKTRLAYARLWLLSEKEKLQVEIQPKVKSLTQFINSGVSQGAYGKGDLAMFNATVARNEARLLGIKAEKLAAEAELIQQSSVKAEGKKLKNPGLPKGISLDFAESRLSNNLTKSQKRAKLIEDLAKAQTEVAERDAFPELRPKLSYSRTNEGADIVGVGISFDLPFYSQNDSERLRKKSAQQSASAKLNFYQSDLFKSSIINSVKTYALRREEVTLYETKVVPATKEALAQFESSVREGQGSILELWQTLREYLEVQDRYLELWAMAFSDYQELSVILGDEN